MPQPQDPKPQELQDKPQDLDYQKDVHAPSLEDIFNEVADEEDDGVPAKKADEKQEEPAKPAEPTTPETKPQEPEKPNPNIDPERLKEEISDATAKKIIEAIAPEGATKEQKKDILDEFLEKHPEPTWQDAFKFFDEQSKLNKQELKQEILKDLQKEVEDEEAKEKQAADDQAKAAEERTKAWNSEWDRQLKVLEDSGRIPKIVDPNDPEDPGKKERIALFTKMKERAEEASKNGQPASLSLLETYMQGYDSPTKKPAGAEAPVAGSRKAVTPSNPGEFSYNDIHNSSLEDLMKG